MCLIGDAKCVNAGAAIKKSARNLVFYQNLLRKIKKYSKRKNFFQRKMLSSLNA